MNKLRYIYMCVSVEQERGRQGKKEWEGGKNTLIDR